MAAWVLPEEHPNSCSPWGEAPDLESVAESESAREELAAVLTAAPASPLLAQGTAVPWTSYGDTPEKMKGSKPKTKFCRISST